MERPSTSRRVTQADVAKRAGVSAPLVSSVISGSSKNSRTAASPDTRERIWKAVRELGYFPNVAARRLAGGRSKLLSVFTYEPVFPSDSENFYHDFFVGVEQESDAQGYSLVLVTSSRDTNGKRAIYVDGSNSLQLGDGAIILGRSSTTVELERLASDGFPFVNIGRRDVAPVAISYVTEDNHGAARRAAEVLVEHGHRRIGFVSSGHPTEQAMERREGFFAGARGQGLGDADVVTLFAKPRGLIDDVLSEGLTGVVLETPRATIALRGAALRRGLRVPGDLSMISMGGWINRVKSPKVSEFSIPQREIGRTAVRNLISLIAEPAQSPIQERIPLEEDLRHTVGPPSP